MTQAVWHDSLSNLRHLVPGVGALSVTDLPEIHQQAPEAYEAWRQWRYEHISLEFEMATWRFARLEWERKRPWWLGPR